jgi:hypothetical protein
MWWGHRAGAGDGLLIVGYLRSCDLLWHRGLYAPLRSFVGFPPRNNKTITH